jgi:hypothetical protein
MSYKNAASTGGEDLFTIIVETLTGTTFEVKVSPQDTIKSIKTKIQRVEGKKIFFLSGRFDNLNGLQFSLRPMLYQRYIKSISIALCLVRLHSIIDMDLIYP